MINNITNSQKYFEIYKQKNGSNCNNWMQLLIIKDKKIKINKLLLHLNQNNIQAKRAWSNINKYNYLKMFPSMKNTNNNFFSKIILLPSNEFEFIKK